MAEGPSIHRQVLIGERRRTEPLVVMVWATAPLLGSLRCRLQRHVASPFAGMSLAGRPQPAAQCNDRSASAKLQAGNM